MGRAAQAAPARTTGLGCVALERAVAGEAERFAAARDHAAVAAEQLGLCRRDLEHGLDPIEVRPELVGAELAEAELALPLVEHAIGRAIARTRVDGRGAADRLTEGNRNADV